MRIGIDARRLTRTRLDGRFSYLKNALSALLAQDGQHEYVLFVDAELADPAAYAKPNVHIHTLPRTLGRGDTPITDWWRLGHVSRRLGVDGIHLPVDPYPRVAVPHVVTAHDLMVYAKHYRGDLPLARYLQVEAVLAYSRLTYRHVVSTSRRVICITEFMKNQFRERLGLPDSQMSVIYPGGDNQAFRVIDDEAALTAFRQRIGVARRYVMAFGNKNLVVLLKAFGRLPQATRNEFMLVVTGPTLQGPDELAELTDRLGVRGQVAFFSKPLPHEDLCWFYNAASLFVLPSQYEMFCNMLLEAMRCRCPVLASGLAPNVEVGADAMAYYSAINDPDDLATALRQLLESDDARTALARRGHARGATFTWKQHAAQLAALYSEAFAL
jgi:glycosyltransferase involved in cell wall biosynthesis